MSSKLKDNAELYHTWGLNLSSKTMTLIGDVDNEMYEKATKNLEMLDSIKNGKPITIKIKSGGGSVTAGLAIHDLIKKCDNFVRIIVEGNCESMATIILQAGDERCILKHSHLMLHIGVGGYEEDQPENIERWRKKNAKDEKDCRAIYMKKIKEKKKRFTEEKLTELLRFDTILSPKEAIELGLLDKIVPEE